MPKSSHIAAALAVFGFVAMATGQASAQERPERVFWSALQTAANRSSVEQQGGGNAAATVQNGTGNSAAIRQVGRNNSGAITQTGTDNTACLIQVGRGVQGAITQTGSHNSLGILQTRGRVREIPPELCELDGTRRGLAMGALRYAVRSAATR